MFTYILFNFLSIYLINSCEYNKNNNTLDEYFLRKDIDLIFACEKDSKKLSIVLENTDLSVNTIQYIFNRIITFKYLEDLDINFKNCNIRKNEIIELNIQILKLTNIKKININLDNNFIKNDELLQLLMNIQKLEKLQSVFLNLTNNQLDDDLKIILETLHLIHNNGTKIQINVSKNRIKVE